MREAVKEEADMRIGKERGGEEQRPDVVVVPPVRQPERTEPAPEPVRVAPPEREMVPA